MEIYNQLVNKLKDQRGGVAIIVAIIVVFIVIALMALAIDVGRLYATKNELQNVADAAALAGAGKLGEIYKGLTPEEQDTYDFSADQAVIVASAQDVVGAGKNKVGGENITIDTGDIIIYNVTDAGGNLRFGGPNNYNLPDAVRVTARRDSDPKSAEGPITTFFAKILGFGTADVWADATAALTTLDEVGPGEMNMPIGLSENLFPNNCTDTIQFSPTTTSCAGWHNFFDAINANAMNDKLLGFILDDPTIHSGGPDDGDYGDCIKTPCGRANTSLYPEGWLDAYFDMNPGQVPPAAYTPGVDANAEDTFFEFQGGTISALFNGGKLAWDADANGDFVIPRTDPTSGQQVVLDDDKHPAPFFAIFDYFRFRDNIEIPATGISVDTNGDGTDNLTVRHPDAVWSGLVPVYEDDPTCINPNTDLKIVGFAIIHVLMPLGPPNNTIVAKVDCNLTFIGGQGGGGFSGNVRGTIPNLVE